MKRILWFLFIYLLLILHLPAQTKGIIHDADGYTNLRKGPGSRYEVVTKIREGQPFEYTRISESSWWRVRLKNGKEGYVHKSRIQPYAAKGRATCSVIYPWGDSDEKPNLIANIGGRQVLVGGSLLQKASSTSVKISEFSLTDCRDGSMIKFYEALQTCWVTAYSDRIEIVELANLPVGKDLKKKTVPFSKEVLTASGGELVLSPREVILDLSNISPEQVAQVETAIPAFKNKGFSEQMETFMAKLAVCSMKGSEKCRAAFENFEAFTGAPLDGAYAETHAELSALIGMYENR